MHCDKHRGILATPRIHSRHHYNEYAAQTNILESVLTAVQLQAGYESRQSKCRSISQSTQRPFQETLSCIVRIGCMKCCKVYMMQVDKRVQSDHISKRAVITSKCQNNFSDCGRLFGAFWLWSVVNTSRFSNYTPVSGSCVTIEVISHSISPAKAEWEGVLHTTPFPPRDLEIIKGKKELGVISGSSCRGMEFTTRAPLVISLGLQWGTGEVMARPSLIKDSSVFCSP